MLTETRLLIGADGYYGFLYFFLIFIIVIIVDGKFWLRCSTDKNWHVQNDHVVVFISRMIWADCV